MTSRNHLNKTTTSLVIDIVTLTSVFLAYTHRACRPSSDPRASSRRAGAQFIPEEAGHGGFVNVRSGLVYLAGGFVLFTLAR